MSDHLYKPVPWQSVIQAILAVDAEASRRGEMFPQTADEQRVDRKAASRVVEMVTWYANHGGAVAEQLKDWPQEAVPAFPRRPSASSVLEDAAREVLAEVARATAKFPTWPTDPLHALTVLGEEFGELTKDMLQLTYEPHKTDATKVRTEALQTAAMALRLFMSLSRYEYRPSVQHSQQEGGAA